MSGVENYARQMNIIGNQVHAMLYECQHDCTLTDEQREDISWEIARAKESLAQSIASLVDIAVKSMEP